MAKRFDKIRFLLVLETDVANYSFGAWMDDALVGLKHFTQWRKFVDMLLIQSGSSDLIINHHL